MTTQNPSDEEAERELAELVACTLSDRDLKTQRERWITLGKNCGIARYESEDGLRLTFEDHPAVEAELHALVAVENECCSWAAWSVERSDDGALVLAVRARSEGIATLHAMFTEAGKPPP